MDIDWVFLFTPQVTGAGCHGNRVRALRKVVTALGLLLLIGGGIISICIIVSGEIRSDDRTVHVDRRDSLYHHECDSEATAIRGLLEAEMVTSETETGSEIGRYLKFLEASQYEAVMAFLMTGLCEIDARFGTLEELASDIIAGMVTSSGTSDYPVVSGVIVSTLYERETYTGVQSLSCTLRYLSESTGLIDSASELTNLLDAVAISLADRGNDVSPM